MDALIMLKDLEYYKGKRVFVTGHTGFKGSWLTKMLLQLGASVHGFSHEKAKNSLFNQMKLEKHVNHRIGDIRDSVAIEAAIKAAQPDCVFHLAAQALVRRSYADPLETFSTNIMGTANLMMAAKDIPSIETLVCITSDKCYENLEWVWGYRETDMLGGHDPYSASKASAEIVFSAMQRSYFDISSRQIGTATVRAGNVIGGGDFSVDRIVPDCIRAISSQAPIELRNPNSTRPWQHVLDPLAGYLLLGARLAANPRKYSGAWNFGPDLHDVKTVHELSVALVSYFDSNTEIKVHKDATAHEANLLQLNCDKAKLELQWRPSFNTHDAIKATAEWYYKVMNGVSAETQTAAQISEFFGLQPPSTNVSK